MPERLRHEQRGLTIVEVGVALLLILIGIAGTFAVFDASGRTTSAASRNEVARQQAEQALEELRSLRYDRLVMGTRPPASTSAGDPPSRVSNGPSVDSAQPVAQFNPDVAGQPPVPNPGGRNPKQNEDLSLPPDGGGAPPATDCTGGDHTSATGPVDACSRFTVGSGTTAVSGRIYRFVSFKDEECPVLDLTELTSELGSFRSLVAGLAGNPNGSLRALVSDGALLDDLVAAVADVNAGPNGVLSLLLLPLYNDAKTTLGGVMGQLDPVASAIDQHVAPLLTPLTAVLAQLEPLLSLPTQALDLCDLPGLPDLSQIETLTASLTTLTPVLDDVKNGAATALAQATQLNATGLVSSVLNTVDSTLNSLLSQLTSALAGDDDAIESLQSDLANAPAELSAIATELQEFVANADLDTTHNSKRLTVAVVLDPVNGIAPHKPVWASTIATDPRDGLG